MARETEIQTYDAAGFGSIRAFEEDGQAWFVASDVAKALGYDKATFMTRSLDEDEKGVHTVHTPGGPQEMSVITEAGAYHAILMRKSACVKDPDARQRVVAFQRWITHEVIPSIRRHGAYVNPAGAETPEELIARALDAAHAILARREERIRALEAENADMRPGAEFARAVEGANTSVLVRDLARLLTQNGFDVGQNRLFDMLRKDGYLVRAVGRDRNLPTRRSMEMGLMEVRETAIQTSHGAKVRITPLVTGKGQAYFLRRYAGVGA